jgi:hypothetical protein
LENKKITIADFSPHLFWDVKSDTVDTLIHQRLIVERVIQRGSMNDLSLLQQLYNIDNIRSVIKQISWLNDKDMAFVNIYFDIPLSELKCYTKKQSARFC